MIYLQYNLLFCCDLPRHSTTPRAADWESSRPSSSPNKPVSQSIHCLRAREIPKMPQKVRSPPKPFRQVTRRPHRDKAWITATMGGETKEPSLPSSTVVAFWEEEEKCGTMRRSICHPDSARGREGLTSDGRADATGSSAGH